MKTRIFQWYESSYENVFIFPVSPHCGIETGQIIEPERISKKFKTRWSRSLRLNGAPSFLKVAHQCQTISLPVAVVVCSLLASFDESMDIASFDETIDNTSGPVCFSSLHCTSRIFRWKIEPTAQDVSCAVDIFVVFQEIFFAETLQGWSWRLVLCWNVHCLRSRTLAQRCTAHESEMYIEPWPSPSAGRRHRHRVDHALVKGVFTAD